MQNETNTTDPYVINIAGLDKAEVLAALYNASKQQGMGFLHAHGAQSMSVEQAREELAARKLDLYFDYLHGRVMKIDLNGEQLYIRLYDRDNGAGAAAQALATLIAARDAKSV